MKHFYNLSTLKERIKCIRLIVFDFDGVFTDNMVTVHQDGSESVQCFRSDGLGLKKLKNLGIESIIISTETNPVTTMRSRKLGIACLQGCEDKGLVLTNLVEEKGLSLNEIAFVGNDINDLPCLTIVGLPIVVQDAYPEIIPYALYQTRKAGGHGAVREICDLFENTLLTEKFSH